jgi:hypothetical protein
MLEISWTKSVGRQKRMMRKDKEKKSLYLCTFFSRVGENIMKRALFERFFQKNYAG